MIAGGLGMALSLDLLGGWVCGVWLQDFPYCDAVLPETILYPGSPTTIFYSLVYKPQFFEQGFIIPKEAPFQNGGWLPGYSI